MLTFCYLITKYLRISTSLFSLRFLSAIKASPLYEGLSITSPGASGLSKIREIEKNTLIETITSLEHYVILSTPLCHHEVESTL